jgi:hypothetical protein
MNRTLVDLFELRRTEYRSRTVTLHDPFELRERLESLELEAEWEESTRDACIVVVESAPRGVGHQAWTRARNWCH